MLHISAWHSKSHCLLSDKEFASKYKKVFVIEELDDIIETHCKSLVLTLSARKCSLLSVSILSQ
jgi:TPP-dependent indolepyruvate ferredoxin oxidoreductase alpha subunit